MKRISVVMVLFLMCIGTTACSTSGGSKDQSDSENINPAQTGSSEDSGYKNIKPEEAKKRLENEKGIILLDVRTYEEYTEKHIPGSILIPVDAIEKEAPSKLTDKNATIFVYCRTGRRSAIAAEALAKMGYTNVYNLGGIIDWPYETN